MRVVSVVTTRVGSGRRSPARPARPSRPSHPQSVPRFSVVVTVVGAAVVSVVLVSAGVAVVVLVSAGVVVSVLCA